MVLGALALGSASLAASGLLRRGSGRKLAVAPFGGKDSEAARSSKRYIMYLIVPAWSLVGALDWLWLGTATNYKKRQPLPSPEQDYAAVNL